MNDIKQFLRSNALRPTKQRIVIAGYLFDGTDKHVTAESLSTELAKRKHIISLATIYNTLHDFYENGLLKKLTLSADRVYFDTNTDDHHHFYIFQQVLLPTFQNLLYQQQELLQYS